MKVLADPLFSVLSLETQITHVLLFLLVSGRALLLSLLVDFRELFYVNTRSYIRVCIHTPFPVFPLVIERGWDGWKDRG